MPINWAREKRKRVMGRSGSVGTKSEGPRRSLTDLAVPSELVTRRPCDTIPVFCSIATHAPIRRYPVEATARPSSATWSTRRPGEPGKRRAGRLDSQRGTSNRTGLQSSSRHAQPGRTTNVDPSIGKATGSQLPGMASRFAAQSGLPVANGQKTMLRPVGPEIQPSWSSRCHELLGAGLVPEPVAAEPISEPRGYRGEVHGRCLPRLRRGPHSTGGPSDTPGGFTSPSSKQFEILVQES